MTDVFAIRKGVPIPFSNKPKTGLTETLRRMEYGDSIVVPNSKRGSVYSCAAQAGIEVQTQSSLDGSTTTVWRVDEGAAGPALDLESGTDSTHQSILTADGEFPSGEYRQDDPWGPSVWYADCDEQGRPINRFKKKTSEPEPVAAKPEPAAETAPGTVATEPAASPQPQSSEKSSTAFWPDWDSVGRNSTKTIFD